MVQIFILTSFHLLKFYKIILIMMLKPIIPSILLQRRCFKTVGKLSPTTIARYQRGAKPDKKHDKSNTMALAKTLASRPAPPRLEPLKHDLVVDETALDPVVKSEILHNLEESKANNVLSLATEEDVESIPRSGKPFVDYLWVEVKAGNGGEPVEGEFRRKVPVGPGWGGHGANVYLKATHLIDSFLGIDQTIKADRGGDAQAKSRGSHANHCFIQVPVGTIVRERVDTGLKTDEGRKIHRPVFKHQFLGKLAEETIIIAKGGLGGIAPKNFKSQDGRKGGHGERRKLELELRVLTDVSLLGKYHFLENVCMF